MKTESVIIQREMATGQKSRLARYSDLIIGRRGFGPLLKYELIVLLCARVPGLLGLWLRAKLYPGLLGKCGRNVVFGANIVLRHPHKIEIGDNVIIDDNCLLDAKGRDNTGIRIGTGVFLGRNSILSCKNGDIVLGTRVNIGFNCEVFPVAGSRWGPIPWWRPIAISLAAITIPRISKLPSPSRLRSLTVLKSARSAGLAPASRCWMGSRLAVTPLSAQALSCTRSVPDYALAVGVPARVVRDRRDQKP